MKYYYEYKLKNGAKVGGHNLEDITFIKDMIALFGFDKINDEECSHWRILLKSDEIEYLKIEPMENNNEHQ